MTIIDRIARKSFDANIVNGFKSYKDVISQIKYKVNEIDSEFDKIKFINIHLELIKEKFSKHLLECKNPDACQINFDCESIAYFLR